MHQLWNCNITKNSDCKASLPNNIKSETPRNKQTAYSKSYKIFLIMYKHRHLRKQTPNSYLHRRPVGDHRLIEVDMDYGSQS